MVSSLVKTGRQLEYVTVGWNTVEAVIAITAGAAAGSVSLIGFGLDSIIESSSGAVLLWRLKEGDEGRRREERALKLVGWCFLLLAGYVLIDASNALFFKSRPESSIIGIVLAAVSLIVMPVLAHYKRRVATRIGSKALEADSRQTDFCAYLSAILLVGLLLNTLLGWWWADPVAALAMVPIIALEGRRAIRAERCETCSP